MGDHQQDEEMMGDQPQQDEEEEASTPATMRQSKIVKEIMGKVVAEKSSINYARQNATFALFVYEKNEELRGHLLESWFVERLAAFATLTEKKKYVQDVSWHAARRTITVLLYCQISHSPILVIFSQCEPGVDEKIKAGQIRWGFPRTIWQRVHSFIFIG